MIPGISNKYFHCRRSGRCFCTKRCIYCTIFLIKSIDNHSAFLFSPSLLLPSARHHQLVLYHRIVIVRDGIQLGEGKSVVLGLMAKCGLIKAFCPSTSLDSGNCQNELITEAFAIKYWSFNGISMASDWLKILFNYNFALINSDRCLWFAAAAAAAEQEEEFCSEQGYLMKFFNSHYISHQQPPFQVKLILQVAHNYYNLHLKVRWFRVHKKFKICAH